MKEAETPETSATVPAAAPVAAAAQTRDGEPEREVRFAVVIYGGVSLAIYINGVVQEMLHMVRATAKDPAKDKLTPYEELTPVEKVYRKLGQIVGEPEDAKSPTVTRVAATDANGEQEKFLKDRPGKAGLRPDVRAKGIAQAATKKADAAAKLAEVAASAGAATSADAAKGKTGAGEKESDAARDDKAFEVEAGTPVYARFVVDILSGTSAGGINAIFMAKALANNMSIDSLAQLWITQADLDLLLNDEKVKPSNLRQSPVPSLLNSPWMYFQLLKALSAMNDTRKEGVKLVEDLDLFCTTTDLRGLPIKIALTDESVKEQRYRNVYHFKRRALEAKDEVKGKGEGENHDFTEDMDPFLAFAARCTSSFPFAFEPMMLSDIVTTIRENDELREEYWTGAATTDQAGLFGTDVVKLEGAEKFAEICNVYRVADEDGHFASRPFGDGGYLNNKPFTYAIETLKKRHATLPVDRKLIYVEPGPERVKDDTKDGTTKRPNVIENSLDALVVLPRYETIRQNIESVVQWNSDIGRLHRVIGHIEDELKKQAEKEQRGGPAENYMDSLSYTIYWKLRLSGAADQLACRLADALNVETDSAEGQALRVISGEWRVRMFDGPDPNAADVRAQQRFLDFFDFDYCERAIRFLRGKLQHLPAKTDVEKKARRDHLTTLAGISAAFQGISEMRLDLDLTKLAGPKPKKEDADREYLNCWRQYLQFIVDPRRAALVLGVPDECGETWKDGCHEDVDPTELKAMLNTSDGGRNARVRWLFAGLDTDRSEKILVTTIQNPMVRMDAGARVGFNAIVALVAEVALKSYAERPPLKPGLAGVIKVGQVATTKPAPIPPEDELPYYNPDARPPFTDPGNWSRLEWLHKQMEPLFKAIERKPADAADRTPNNAASSGLEFFKRQDVQVYPVIFGTTLGEFEQVEIFRISPDDTRGIANTNPPGEQSKPPLRGTSLADFGAFLDQDWRMSDMLSGRLDGAERLITAVLPDSDEQTVRWREHMIKEAQEAIAEEWVTFEAGLNLKRSPEKQTQVDLMMQKSVEDQKGDWLSRQRWRLARWINPAMREPQSGPLAGGKTPVQSGDGAKP